MDIANKLSEKLDFETGDILLFSHDNQCNNCVNTFLSCFNDCIKCCTTSKYSHSAIIVKDPDFFNDKRKGLFVLESSYETFPDAENGRKKLGVELEEFDKVYNDWKGQIYWRKLNCNRNQEFYQKFNQIHSDVHNLPYDIDPVDWVKAKFKINVGNTQRRDTFWCASLVAYIYVKLGLLKSNTPWSLVSPKELGTEVPTDLHFVNCSLNKEVKIKKIKMD